MYTIYTAPFPTLVHGWRSITVFWSQIFGHVRGVEANFEKIKNVSSKNKVDDLKLGVGFFYANMMKSVQ